MRMFTVLSARKSTVRASFTAAMLLAVGCSRNTPQPRPEVSSSALAAGASSASAPPAVTPPKPEVPSPTRLVSLPLSAYATSIAMDDDAVYLMTSHAAYRLVAGEPAHGIRLELGIGPVLTRSAFVFWSNGAIWSAPKQGGETRQLAKFASQPQYFVTSGEAFAWVTLAEDGVYTIQTLDHTKPRVLLSSPGELRGLVMVGDTVYFVQRPSNDSWRIGSVHLDGRPPEFGLTRKGRAPAQLTASDSIYYFDLDTRRVLSLSPDLRHEEVQLKDFVCSPIQVSTRIYCACVEGLFDVDKDSHEPRVLVANRPGTITGVTSNSRAVAWTVDVGADQLAVELLLASELEGKARAR